MGHNKYGVTKWQSPILMSVRSTRAKKDFWGGVLITEHSNRYRGQATLNKKKGKKL